MLRPHSFHRQNMLSAHNHRFPFRGITVAWNIDDSYPQQYLLNFRATFSPANNGISACSENFADWKLALRPNVILDQVWNSCVPTGDCGWHGSLNGDAHLRCIYLISFRISLFHSVYSYSQLLSHSTMMMNSTSGNQLQADPSL